MLIFAKRFDIIFYVIFGGMDFPHAVSLPYVIIMHHGNYSSTE